MEMRAFQKDLASFEKLGAQVLGISVDSVFCHKEWAKSLGGLTYPLLADFWPHGGVAQKYGVFNEGGYCNRSIFVVDESGKITWTKMFEKGLPDNAEICSALGG